MQGRRFPVGWAAHYMGGGGENQQNWAAQDMLPPHSTHYGKPCLSNCCLVWAQNCTKKPVRIISFQPRNSHTSLLFKQSSILKFPYKICLENISFVSKSLNNLSTSVFKTWFSFSSDQHNYETSRSTQGNLTKLFYQTNR